MTQIIKKCTMGDKERITDLEKQLESQSKEINSLKNSSGNAGLKEAVEKQENTIARLENDLKRLGDPNSKPRVIQKGNQVHPKYVKNTDKIAPTIPKEEPAEPSKE